MVRYRIAVGREHGAQPKNIVGAIANEVGLDSQYIGHIKLYDTYSTVDLPEGMPGEAFKHLKQVRVCGQQLKISVEGAAGKSVRQQRGKPKKSDGKNKPGGKGASKRGPKAKAKSAGKRAPKKTKKSDRKAKQAAG